MIEMHAKWGKVVKSQSQFVTLDSDFSDEKKSDHVCKYVRV